MKTVSELPGKYEMCGRKKIVGPPLDAYTRNECLDKGYEKPSGNFACSIL